MVPVLPSAVDAEQGGAVSDGHRSCQIDSWESRIRRTLLVAHLAPAVFGLGAVTLAHDPAHRRGDIVAWGLVVLWAGFLLAAGWRRVGQGTRLGRWVIADAVVMAALMFVGTTARPIVHYVAIDGALYAAAFVSTRLGILQLGIVFAGLAAAAVARAHGSEIPTELVGWVLPAVLPTLGVIAFGFLRRGLQRMHVIVRQREAMSERRGRLAAEVAAREETFRGVVAIDEVVGGAIADLDGLVELYATLALPVVAAHAEVEWLRQCADRAADDLAHLREAISGNEGGETLIDAIDTGLLGASVAHLNALTIHRRVDDLAERTLRSGVSAAISGFVREGVANAVTHGQPPVEVVARCDGERLTIAVIDCGPGPTGDQLAASTGLGMTALHEYAATLHGRVEFEHTSRGCSLVLVGDVT